MNDWCDIRKGCINSREYWIVLAFILIFFLILYVNGFTIYDLLFTVLFSLILIDHFPKQLGMTGTRLIISIVQFLVILFLMYVAYNDGQMTGLLMVVGVIALIVTALIVNKRYGEHNRFR